MTGRPSGEDLRRGRRAFLGRGLAAGAGFALSSVRGRAEGRGRVDPATVQGLSARLEGQLILPDHQAYDAARKYFYWNPTLDRHPALIARCQGPEDVARCVEFAREHDLPLAVRGGGHGYVGWCAPEGGLVVDVSPMKRIDVDPSSGTVRAGAGVVAHELVDAAAAHGLAPVVGQCRDVGISGLTLGGGLGWLSGLYGASCDNLLSATLVTADGRSRVASPLAEPDLFWGIRGGGGNFGVATSLEYRLHPLEAAYAGGLSYRLSDARAMLRFYRDFMAESPDGLQALAFLRRDRQSIFRIVVFYAGSPEGGEGVVRPLRTHATPVADTVRSRPYGETFSDAAGDHRTFRAVRGRYLAGLSDEAVEAILERFGKAPLGAAIGLDHYMHGAVCRQAPGATAFELRRPGALHVWITTRWSDPLATDRMVGWCEDTWRELQPHAAGRVYANYPKALGDRAARAAYGGSYDRLRALKGRYDPLNLFSLNQNVRPASS